MSNVQHLFDQIADHLENYVDAIDRFIIFEGASEKKIKNSKKVVKKAVKALRKGEYEKVFTQEFIEQMEDKYDL